MQKAAKELQACEERIVELEIRAAQQERMLEELSYILKEQWEKIGLLERTTRSLLKKIELLYEQNGNVPLPERPPHW